MKKTHYLLYCSALHRYITLLVVNGSHSIKDIDEMIKPAGLPFGTKLEVVPINSMELAMYVWLKERFYPDHGVPADELEIEDKRPVLRLVA
ncbi:hypothetical protein ID144_23725 [Pseudomonas sp. JM0905a]|uniref:hypothetical protein n=1 Tax=Pseudomonas sp. JM0905a TaxID=2772484 RepID=UPI0016892D96|nr:hypothetical protein [Pseudomonas sp. JM0905a]MBD2840057.1 hypothetical protein [Pseudomonas sp. JM0905a]